MQAFVAAREQVALTPTAADPVGLSYRPTAPTAGRCVRSSPVRRLRLLTDPTAIHHGVPSTALTVVIAFDEPLDCSWLDGRTGDRYAILVAGLHTSPALIRTHGLQRGIQLALTPLGCRALLGTPPAALANELVPGPELGLSDTVHDRLDSADWHTRFDLVEELLVDRLNRHRWSVDPIAGRPGNGSRRSAGTFGWSISPPTSGSPGDTSRHGSDTSSGSPRSRPCGSPGSSTLSPFSSAG